MSTLPFVFGVKVEGDMFTDRIDETKRLVANFQHGINTIIISPRRMGKTSLVEKVVSLTASNEMRIAKMDAFGCRSEREFVDAFATAVIRATSTKWEEWVENAKSFLSRFSPKFTISQDPQTSFSVSLEYTQPNHAIEDILELPEMIAKQKQIDMVICIDEFQQIGEFPDSLTFQKKLRSVWQLQSHVHYCLYGSKKHMMEKIFLNRHYPFYQFGDLMYLKKIKREEWVSFICDRFAQTGKHISNDLAQQICAVTEDYSSYVQQLAWLVWLQTDKETNAEDLSRGINSLLDANEALFIQQTENLSEYQMNFLKAIYSGIHTGFTQQSVLQVFHLGTSANITKLKKALQEKDLITLSAPNHLDLSDPILGLWLKQRVWMKN